MLLAFETVKILRFSTLNEECGSKVDLISTLPGQI